jgi:hypothetical protein
MTFLDWSLDPQLLGSWLGSPTFEPARVVLKSLQGLPLTPKELEFFCQCTGRTVAQTEPASELWLAAGRRSGKTLLASALAVMIAAGRNYREVLRGPGELAVVMILAADRRQSRVAFRYVRGMFEAPMLRRLIEAETKESITLTTGAVIEIHTSNFKAVRGYSVAAAIGDEVAFWSSEDSANPDHEIINALRPAMATIPGALLIGLSSPYSRRGVLWDQYRAHFGQDGDPVLFWQASSRQMNETISQGIVDGALAADEAAASAEWLGLFRRDIEGFVSREQLEAVTITGRDELPPASSAGYVAFCDAASGSGSDSFTVAVAHRRSDGVVVLDAVRERRPPFVPQDTVNEFAEFLKTYKCFSVSGDRYSGEWVADAFRRAGIQYRTSDRTRSEIYLESLPLITGRRVELLDHAKLLAQLASLERRTSRVSGRETVDHPPGKTSHDDVCNSAMGALLLAGRGARRADTRVLYSPGFGAPRRERPVVTHVQGELLPER